MPIANQSLMTIDTSQQFNPFPGLRPFSTEEDYLFFGREEQTAELLGLLRAHRFLAVVGTSGSGKSSLVRAGLLPALHGGTMTQAGSSWEVILLRPGGDPVTNLARALLDAELYDADDEESLPRIKATLSRSRMGLVEAIKQSDLEPDTNLLVVVDQFEELFRFRQTGVSGQEAASAFVKLLLAATRQTDQRIYVAITMRSDYLGDCAEIPGLAEAVNDGEYLIPRLTREQRRAAIERPVSVAGGKIATRLVHKLLNDVGDDTDQLPVLQHALLRIWDYWSADRADGEPLDLRHYQRVGGLHEALSLHADEVFAELPDDRSRLIAERLFKALTERGPDNRGIRRPKRVQQLCAILDGSPEEVTAVIDAFRQPGRTFLMPMQEVELAADTVIDISHESLMRVWKRLDRWVEEESQSARIYRRLAETAALHAEGKAGVYHDPDLQIALTWRETAQPNEAWARQYHEGFQPATDFLETSSEAQRQEEQAREAARQRELQQARKLAETERLRAEEQQRAARRLKGLVVAVGVVAVLAFFAFLGAMFAQQQAKLAESHARISEQEARSHARRAEDERQRAVEAQQVADEQRERADAQRELARRSLYVAQINKAQRTAETAGGAGRLASLLSGLRPTSQESDLRGWEWYFLSSPRDSGFRSIPAPSALYCVDFSPDGSKLAFGGANNEATIWDLAADRELVVLRGHTAAMIMVIWSPDGRQLATSGLDGTARIWDAQSGLPLHTLQQHSGPVSVAWNSDGSRLATSGVGDHTVCIWDPVSGKRLQLVSDDAGLPCVWAPNDQMLAFKGSQNSVIIWDVEQGVEVTRIQHEAFFWGLGWHPDGSRIASADDAGRVLIWDPLAAQPESAVLSGHSATVFDLEWSPSGKQLATASFDQTARVWDVEQGTTVEVFSGHTSRLYDVSWHPGGRQLATASVDGSVIVWDLDDEGRGEEVFASHGEAVHAVWWSPDSRRLATAGSDRTVKVWDAEVQREVHSLAGHTAAVNCLAWSPDGARLASGGNDDTIRIWDAESGDELAVLSGHVGAVVSLAWSATGKWLAAGVTLPDRFAATPVYLWNVADLQSPAKVLLRGHGGAVLALAWSPDATRLATGGAEPFALDAASTAPRIRIWDPETAESLATFSGEYEIIDTLAWSPDGNHLATGGHYWDAMGAVDASVRVWDLETGQATQVLRGHPGELTSVDWMADGSRLVSASKDGSLIVWNPHRGEELLTFAANGAAVASVDWSPDGTRIALGDAEGTIQVLDARDGYQRERSDKLLVSLDARIADGAATAEEYEMRAQIHARHGRWDQAAADFERATELQGDEATPWFMTQWWLVGPYPEDLQAPFPPESAPDPFQPLTAAGGEAEGDIAPLRWEPVFSSATSGLDLEKYFDNSEHMTCYVSTRLYSPSDQPANLLLGSDDIHRLWLNGDFIHESTQPRRLLPDQDTASVALRAGWNQILFKVVNQAGGYGLSLRVSNDPARLARAFERAGRWEQALAQWDRAIELAPDKFSLRLERIAASRQAGHLERAAAELAELSRSYPDSSALLTDRAALYRTLGRWADALAIHDQLVQLRPDDWDLRLERGRVAARLGEEAVVTPGSAWKWRHPSDGVDPATRDTDFHETFFRDDFDDAAWNTDRDRPGQSGGFGYRLLAAVDIGAPASGTATSAYFRQRFETRAPLSDLYLTLQMDDGVIIYLDGVEVARDNIVQAEAFQARAASNINPDNRAYERRVIRLPGALEPGEHLLAISLHNWIPTSNDLRIADISLQGSPPNRPAPAPLEHPAELIGRALTLEELGRGGEAEADFAQAFAKLLETPEDIGRLAAVFSSVADVYIERGQLPMAVAILDRAIQSRPDDPLLVQTRGNLHGRRRQWKQAAADLAQAVELDPDDHWNWYRLAPLLVESGEHDRYREHCRELIARFSGAAPLEAGRVIQACQLLPDAVEDWSELIQLSEQTMRQMPSLQPIRQCAHGFFEYRAGNYQAALEWIQQGVDRLGSQLRARALFQLAMTYQQLGQTDQAQQTLEEAEQLLDSNLSTAAMAEDLGTGWHDWLVSRLLRREAAELIRGPAYRFVAEVDDLIADEQARPGRDLGEEVIGRLTRVLELKQDDPGLFVRRADRYALRRQWNQALQDYRRAAALATEDTITWMRAAVLLAQLGDAEGYHEHCGQLLANFAETDDPAFAERVAKVSLILRPAPAQHEAALHMADAAVTLDPAHWVLPWARVAKGLAELRVGRHQSAIDWCQQSLDGPDLWYRDAQAHFVQAMAHSRLGQMDVARTALARGAQLLEAQTTTYDSQGLDANWHDWIICQLLHQEAASALGNGGQAQAESDAQP